MTHPLTRVVLTRCRQDVCAPGNARPLPQAVLTTPSLTVGLLPHYLHLLYPQSRQKSQPLACSSWPWHSGQVLIIVDIRTPESGVGGRGSATATTAAVFSARAESGWPFKRRLVIMRHSATACSGEVRR